MEGNGGSRLVVTELSHIKELVAQLQGHLDGSHDRCRHLTSQILSLAERSIGMITSSSPFISETPRGPFSDIADAPFDSTRKRKTMRKHQVRVKAGEGGEAPVDDGHSWRKYGQKPILGSRYPRSYYRCRHRRSQGCPAMKKVQRADDDPTLFDVIYFGTHTCVENTSGPDDAGQLLAAPAPEHNPDAHRSLVFHSPSGGLTVETEEGLATEPQGWNDATAPFRTSPATSDNVADEFFDVEFISSLFS